LSKNKLTGIIVVSIIGVIVLVTTAISCTLSVTQFTLTTDVAPSGAGSVAPADGQYSIATHVTVTATPASGYVFDHWSGDASGNTSTITITMNSNKSLTAHFDSSSTVPEVLFSDNFSHETTIWHTYSDETGSCFYEDGWLHLIHYSNSTIYYITEAHQYFTDFVLEVETKLVGGTDHNWHMVACRFEGVRNYYEFCISAEGYYEIAQWVDDTLTSLVQRTYSSYIHQGQDVVNLIRIECIGSTLSLSVNGHLLDEIIDSTFSGGDIGLGAYSHEDTYTEIAFDNIVVTGPPQ
jgi:uncharacterized repeat protein (TIGR02543 family)